MPHIPHLLLPGPWDETTISLDDGHLKHLRRVLRTADGAPLSYTDGEGTIGAGILEGGAVVRGDEARSDRPSELTMAVAPPSSRQRARYVVEKLAELGVGRLIWVDTAHSEGRAPSPEKARAWAAAATEQSRGAWLLAIDSASLSDLPEPVVFADPGGGRRWPSDVASVVVGPEGGFAPSEMEGRAQVSLGPTILRVETAAIVAATIHGLGRGGP